MENKTDIIKAALYALTDPDYSTPPRVVDAANIRALCDLAEQERNEREAADARVIEINDVARSWQDKAERERERADKAEANAEHWHECFVALNKVIVGETGASAILTAEGLRAEAERADRLARAWRKLRQSAGAGDAMLIVEREVMQPGDLGEDGT